MRAGRKCLQGRAWKERILEVMSLQVRVEVLEALDASQEVLILLSRSLVQLLEHV